jgi:MFS family permease
MIASGSCALLAGLAFGQPLPMLFALAILWGFTIVADSAQFSALVSEYSARTQVGTALTLQISLGFLLTMVSMRALPALASAIGWQWAFVLLVPGPALGALAMQRLTSPPRAAALRAS